MKRIGGVLLGILCTLCIMLCVLPQKAEAAGDEDIYRVTFEYTNLVAGMKRSDVRITNEDSNVDIVNVYIMQNGAVMSDSDTLNMSGNSVRVDITFKPKSGYVLSAIIVSKTSS